MTIYYVVLILVVLFASAAQRYGATRDQLGNVKVNPNGVFVWCTALTFGFFAGFRYQVGSDWYAYYRWTHAHFVYYLEQSWAEPGWKIIGYIATSIVDKQGAAMCAAAFITVILFNRTIAKYSSNYLLSTVLFFLLTWHGCFNGVRQYLAVAVLFAGHRYIYDHKFWKWALVVAVATLCHSTASIMVLMYFVLNRKLDVKQVALLSLATVVLYFSYDTKFSFLSWLKDKEVDGNSVYASNHVSLFRVAVLWAPAIFYGFLTLYHQAADEELNFYGNAILLNAMLMTAAMNSAYLARVSCYTDVYTVMAWPLMLKKLNRNSRIVFGLILLVCYGAYWYYDISIHEDLNNFRLLFGNV